MIWVAYRREKRRVCQHVQKKRKTKNGQVKKGKGNGLIVTFLCVLVRMFFIAQRSLKGKKRKKKEGKVNIYFKGWWDWKKEMLKKSLRKWVKKQEKISQKTYTCY